MSRMTDVLNDVIAEREKQKAKWGEQHRANLPPTTTPEHFEYTRDTMRAICDKAEKHRTIAPGYTGGASWMEVLDEEIYEAYAESNKEKLRAELIQCAAVIVAWVEDLDAHH